MRPKAGAEPWREVATGADGHQLGITQYTRHSPFATEVVRCLTSPAVEEFDAIFNGNVPTIPSAAIELAVQTANPYLKPEKADIVRVERRVGILGVHYQPGSQVNY